MTDTMKLQYSTRLRRFCFHKSLWGNIHLLLDNGTLHYSQGTAHTNFSGELSGKLANGLKRIATANNSECCPANSLCLFFKCLSIRLEINLQSITGQILVTSVSSLHQLFF